LAVHHAIGRREPVVCELAHAHGGHEPHAPQVGQMTRNDWLREPQDLHDIAHAQRTLGQDIQDPNPRRIGKSLEEGIERTDVEGRISVRREFAWHGIREKRMSYLLKQI
jgi:hypothetical protein